MAFTAIYATLEHTTSEPTTTETSSLSMDRHPLYNEGGGYTIYNSNKFIQTFYTNQSHNATRTKPVAAVGSEDYQWGYLALCVVILCTALGNILVCLAVSRERRLQNMTNYFLMSLAIADLLVAILVMPLGMIVLLFGFFPLDPAICVIWAMTDVCMCTASIWHMCTMSMDRYFTLRYPMKYGRNKTKKMVALKICIVWVISLAISSPIAISGFTDYSNVFNNGVCVPTMKNFVIYGSLFAFYIPLLIMIVTYVLTLQILYRNQKHMHGSKMRHSKTDSCRSSVGSNFAQTATMLQCHLSGIQEEPMSAEKQKSSESRTQHPSNQSTSSSSSSITSAGNSRVFSAEDFETGVINRASSCTLLTSRGTSSDTPPRPRSQTVSMNPLQNLTTNAFLSLLVTMGSPLELKTNSESPNTKAHSFSSLMADTIEKMSSSRQGSNWSQNDCKNPEEKRPFYRQEPNSQAFSPIRSSPCSISSEEFQECPVENDTESMGSNDKHRECADNKESFFQNDSAKVETRHSWSSNGSDQDFHSATDSSHDEHIYNDNDPNDNLENSGRQTKRTKFHIGDEVLNTSQNNISTAFIHAEIDGNNHQCYQINDSTLRLEYTDKYILEQNDPPSNGHIPSDPPSNGHIPSDPPSNEYVPLDPPSNGHIHSDPPSNGHIPSDPPSNGHIPSDSPSNGHVPSDPPSNGYIPSDPPSNGHIPSDPPSNGHVPSDPPSNGYVPSDPPSNGHVHSFLTNGSAPNSAHESDVVCFDREEHSNHSHTLSKPKTKKRSHFWDLLAMKFRNYKTTAIDNQNNNWQGIAEPNVNQNLLGPPDRLQRVPLGSGSHLQVEGTTTLNSSRNSSAVFHAHSDTNHSSSSNGVVVHPEVLPSPPSSTPAKKFSTCCEPAQTLCQTGLSYVSRCRLSCSTFRSADRRIPLDSLRRNNKLSRHRASNEKKASKVLGIIFAIFVILWAPFFVLNVLSVTCVSCMAATTEDTFTVFVWLGYVASLANPIIYTMFNTSFRRAFIRILMCKKSHRHHHHYHYAGTLAAEHRVRQSLRE